MSALDHRRGAASILRTPDVRPKRVASFGALPDPSLGKTAVRPSPSRLRRDSPIQRQSPPGDWAGCCFCSILLRRRRRRDRVFPAELLRPPPASAGFSSAVMGPRLGARGSRFERGRRWPPRSFMRAGPPNSVTWSRIHPDKLRFGLRSVLKALQAVPRGARPKPRLSGDSDSM